MTPNHGLAPERVDALLRRIGAAGDRKFRAAAALSATCSLAFCPWRRPRS
jgi:hypothetical protein